MSKRRHEREVADVGADVEGDRRLLGQAIEQGNRFGLIPRDPSPEDLRGYPVVAARPKLQALLVRQGHTGWVRNSELRRSPARSRFVIGTLRAG